MRSVKCSNLDHFKMFSQDRFINSVDILLSFFLSFPPINSILKNLNCLNRILLNIESNQLYPSINIELNQFYPSINWYPSQLYPSINSILLSIENLYIFFYFFLFPFTFLVGCCWVILGGSDSG